MLLQLQKQKQKIPSLLLLLTWVTPPLTQLLMPKFWASVLFLLFLSCVHIQTLNESCLLYVCKRFFLNLEFTQFSLLPHLCFSPNHHHLLPELLWASQLACYWLSPPCHLYCPEHPVVFLVDSRSYDCSPCNPQEFLITLKLTPHIEKALPDPSHGCLLDSMSRSPLCRWPSSHSCAAASA